MTNENNTPKIPNNEVTAEKSSPSERKWLFSHKEVEGKVKEFIRAYIRGQLKLNLSLLPADVKRHMEMQTGKPIDEAQAYHGALEGMLIIPNHMLICAGVVDSSNEQYTDSINKLFIFIIMGRINKSIEGTFLATDVDARLSVLEKNQDDTKELVNKILDYVERIDPYGERKK